MSARISLSRSWQLPARLSVVIGIGTLLSAYCSPVFSEAILPTHSGKYISELEEKQASLLSTREDIGKIENRLKGRSAKSKAVTGTSTRPEFTGKDLQHVMTPPEKISVGTTCPALGTLSPESRLQADERRQEDNSKAGK
jgi:hypothetical protein